MKKLMFLAAIAAAVFTGCSSDDAVLGQQDPVVADEATPVDFGVYSTTTRASIITSLDEVGLFAFEQGQQNLAAYSKSNYQPNFMFNQKLTASGTAWTYSPIKYWPNTPNAKVSFFAYAPYEEDLSDDAHIQTPETNSYLNEATPVNGLRLMLAYDQNGPGIEYNLPTDPTKGVDLMWGAWNETGKTTSPADLTKQAIDGKVKFMMKHALSRLAFTVQVITDEVTPSDPAKQLDANTTIMIKRVSLIGNFANKGTLRLYDGQWQIANGNNQTLEFTSDQFSTVVKNGLKTTNDDNSAEKENPLLKSTTAGDNYVMAIPGAKFYIEIEYDVITKVDPAASDPNKNDSKVTNVISTLPLGGGTISGGTTTDGKFTLEAGKAYKFDLKIGMTSVKFDVATDTWGTETEYQVDLPKNN